MIPLLLAVIGAGVFVTTLGQDVDEFGMLPVVRCYASHLDLNPWEVRVFFISDTTRDWLLARTLADVTRYQASIFFNNAGLATVPDSLRRHVPIHELSHVLTAELRILAMQADSVLGDRLSEQLVSRIERWELWHKLCPP